MPFYWGHENLYSPKPPIVTFEDLDPNFKSTDKHFENLIKRYGNITSGRFNLSYYYYLKRGTNYNPKSCEN